MSKLNSPAELIDLAKPYKFASLFKGDKRLIPYNSPRVPKDEHIQRIIDRLNAETLPAGEYLIKCKESNAGDVEPDILRFIKEGQEPAPLTYEAGADSELRFNLRVKTWEYDRLQTEYNELRQRFDDLEAAYSDLETENDELTETVNNLQNNKPQEPAGILSEATLKPLEGLLSQLAPLAQPFVNGLAENAKFNRWCNQQIKLKLLKDKYGIGTERGQRTRSEAAPEPEDDELIKVLRLVKQQAPEMYEELHNNIINSINGSNNETQETGGEETGGEETEE